MDFIADISKIGSDDGSVKITLPKSDSDMGAILREHFGDFDSIPETFRLRGFEAEKLNLDRDISLSELNVLAALMKNLSPADQDKVIDYCNSCDISEPLDVMNVAVQSSEIDVIDISHLGIPTSELAGVKEEVQKSQTYADSHAIFSSGTPWLLLSANNLVLDQYSYLDLESRAQDPTYTAKKYEEMIEDDYNNIDGVIGNNDKKDLSSRGENASMLDYVKSLGTYSEKTGDEKERTRNELER